MKLFLLVAGMTAVTYLPRLIPLLSLSDRKLPPFVRRFLLYIPYTALGALIIPGAFQAIPGHPLAASLGLAASGLCAWLGGGLIPAVASGVGVAFLMLWLQVG
ncbi:branched-subunit amino acid transport protein [Hydrogenispora ethanolica]|uniref:Branched-subunit amino acid transport protein n=1 Tax=Hydrogenispora ethanolica TaxID=1082276 RepID=A0A4R1RAS7_HYDET|nr:AzlD domain-containing protein [Hydrogenispora ethanolica]TCL62759.1 branched-subunit amino acid transport protein [Hydrogenispora ethanolica]